MFALGLVFAVAMVSLAVMLGKDAIVQYRQQRYIRAGFESIFSLALAVLVALGVAITFKAAKPVYPMCCQSNLHQFDILLQAHCYPPVSNYPALLTDLVPADISPQPFVCPSSGNKAGALSNAMEWTDYIYVSGLRIGDPPGIPVIICPPLCHNSLGILGEPNGGNILLLDHSSTWHSDVEMIERLIDDPLANCTNPPPGLRERIYVHVSKQIEARSRGKYRSHGLEPAGIETIAIQPFGTIDAHCIEQIAKAIRYVRPGTRVVTLTPRPLPKLAYYAPRNRYRAETLLLDLQASKSTSHLKIMGITTNDISTTKGNEYDYGIIGASGPGSDAMIVSTFRLRHGNAGDELFLRRFWAIACHELGHTFGLEHCSKKGCIMSDLEGKISTIDEGTWQFCDKCRKRLTGS